MQPYFELFPLDRLRKTENKEKQINAYSISGCFVGQVKNAVIVGLCAHLHQIAVTSSLCLVAAPLGQAGTWTSSSAMLCAGSWPLMDCSAHTLYGLYMHTYGALCTLKQ